MMTGHRSKGFDAVEGCSAAIRYYSLVGESAIIYSVYSV